jgi:membrane-associated phospholipid phosphatase
VFIQGVLAACRYARIVMSSEPQAPVAASGGSGLLRRLGSAARGYSRRYGKLVVVLAALVGTTFPGNQLWAHLYPILFGVPLVLTALQRGNNSAFRLWSAYILGFLAFRVIRNVAEGDGSMTRFEYVITLDRLLGFGQIPTHILQSLWWRPGPGTELDWYLITVYLTYFVLPPLVALLLWAAGSRYLGRYVLASLALFAMGCFLFVVLPTAPPWLAAREGYIPPLHRVVNDRFFKLDPTLFNYAKAIDRTNPVAAMPSLHMGCAWLIALVSWAIRPWLGVVAVVYAASMALALVYTGEHYLVDALAGVALASLAWWLIGRVKGIERESERLGFPAIVWAWVRTAARRRRISSRGLL